ncbi:MAG: CcmD family protein [bacterium]
MRKTTFFIICFSMSSLCGSLFAQPARLVHYQGVLLDQDGNRFTGTTDLHFSIYDTFRSEKQMWSETHTNVTIQDGVYDVLLGSENPLKLSFIEYYLTVKAEGFESESRTMIVGSGYTDRLWFLFSAYTIVWLAIFLYVLSIARRQRKIITDLELLSEANKQTENV